VDNIATHEFLSRREAMEYVHDKRKEVVKKCRKYGSDLLDKLFDIKKAKLENMKEGSGSEKLLGG
jgi:hypothetical protein